ncbi:GRIM-19 [Trinorchestia longiramus]|nr:GRIM-19 [Trinorchestia longiramus]
MSSTAPPMQEMPPEGGYSKINYEKVPAKRVFTAFRIFGAFAAIQSIAIYIRYKYTVPRIRYNEIEMRSATIALLPLLFAERDRAALLQMRRNRDAEEELMKDVEGWKVGTYMGEPIYKTLKDNDFHEPKPWEYFQHSDPAIEDYHSNYHHRK